MFYWKNLSGIVTITYMARQAKIIHNLTIKQYMFARARLNGRSGIQAVFHSYHTKDPNVAKVIASQNMRKLNIRQFFKDTLSAEGLTVDVLAKNLMRIANATPKRVTGATKLQANILCLKLLGVYPD